MQSLLSFMQYQLFVISDPPFYHETVTTEEREFKTLGSQRAQVPYMGLSRRDFDFASNIHSQLNLNR